MNELVSTITREVLKKLNEPASKPCVMVLCARDGQVASRIRASLEQDVDMVFFAEPCAGKKPDRYILPHLCPSAMADLALGRASGSLMTEVLRLLLSGVAIEVLEFGYKAYAETAPGSLYSLYASYAKQLSEYGLTEFKRKGPDTLRFREHLVTEKDVVRARETGASVLLVPASATVTPLALETAETMHLNILKRL